VIPMSEATAKQGPDTRARILDAAEALFMTHGFEATSMRMITGQAGVNLAAVNYHFGSKDALIQEVFRRRLTELNRDRLAALEAGGAGGAAGGGGRGCRGWRGARRRGGLRARGGAGGRGRPGRAWARARAGTRRTRCSCAALGGVCCGA